MPDRLAGLAWPDVVDGLVLAVPLGSTEQHGPHLPLDTDTRIAVALAEGLAARRDDVAVTRRPSRRSVDTARPTGSALPPCPLTSTTPAKAPADRTSSTTTDSSAACPIERVPGKPSCSPLDP